MQKQASSERDAIKRWVISLSKHASLSDDIGKIIFNSSTNVDSEAIKNEIVKAANNLKYGLYPTESFEGMLKTFKYPELREIVHHINATYHFNGHYQSLFKAIESDYLLESNIMMQLEKAVKVDLLMQRAIIYFYPIVMFLFFTSSKSISHFYFADNDKFWLSIIMLCYSMLISRAINFSSEVYDA